MFVFLLPPFLFAFLEWCLYFFYLLSHYALLFQFIFLLSDGLDFFKGLVCRVV